MSNNGKRIGPYVRRKEIGRGTYGIVYEGYHHETHIQVAIKKVLGNHTLGREEAQILRRCADTNHIVQLLDVVEEDHKLYLIMEYMKYDLESLLQKSHTNINENNDTTLKSPLPIQDVQKYLYMIFKGVKEIHERGILHRDLKPNNILLTSTLQIAKLSDFGMAKDTFKDTKEKSIQVVTRSYRAPEIFFGERNYDSSIDIWSIGCIFAELILGEQLFLGSTDLEQLSRIFTVLGSPTEQNWLEAANLPFYLNFNATNPKPLAERFKHTELSINGIDLLSKCLQLDPKKRISAIEALQHAFFHENGQLDTETQETKAKKRRIGDEMKETNNTIDEETQDTKVLIKGRRIL